VGLSLSNIEGLIGGGENLEKLIMKLVEVGKQEKLADTEQFTKLKQNNYLPCD